MALDPGQILDGKYRVGRLIGEGGMGTVYEGENSRIGRRVAIKVLHVQVAAMPEFVERFEREARAAARIGSQHVCDVLDLGDLPNGDRYIVMEYLDGVSFEDRLAAKGKLSAAQLAPIAFELLEGLGTMHNARVIHRDLKPANVFLARLSSGRGEIVKILDFGVAKLQPFEGEVGTMTQTGTMMGTPLYMSPEQARGARDVDGRTDIYAASVMFYRALTGSLPYSAETLNELLFKIVLEDPKPLRDLAPEVDEVFAGIVHKGLSRDLEQRFQTAREYQQAIAVWGRTQGRASLAFATTMQSDPPGPASTPRDVPPIPAVKTPQGMTGANVGTPTAWSEDGPEADPAKVRPAAGAPREGSSPGVTVASGESAGDRVADAVSSSEIPGAAPISAVATTLAVASEPPAGPWNEGPELGGRASANASVPTPGPKLAPMPVSAPVAAVTAVPTPKKSTTPKVAFALGGVAVVAVAALVAFGRGGGSPATAGNGLTATAEPTPPPATSMTIAAPNTPTKADPTPAAATAVGSSTGNESADAAIAVEPTPAVRPAVVGAVRRPDPKTPASAAAGVAVTAAPVATVAPPVASAPAPKPTGSAARKFRTNID